MYGEMPSARMWLLNASHDKFRDRLFAILLRPGKWELWVHTQWLDHLDHIGVTEHGTDASEILPIREYTYTPSLQ